ncbi:hypothetical protein Q0P26_13815, partial [Staphylococcus aureus]|nr:hypothetical protein [Staphylococcus aureus]
FHGVGEATANRPHATTVGLYRLGEGGLELIKRLDVVVDGPRVLVEDAVGLAKPDLVLLNDTDQTFARIALDDASRDVVLEHVSALEPVSRA